MIKGVTSLKNIWYSEWLKVSDIILPDHITQELNIAHTVHWSLVETHTRLRNKNSKVEVFKLWMVLKILQNIN